MKKCLPGLKIMKISCTPGWESLHESRSLSRHSLCASTSTTGAHFQVETWQSGSKKKEILTKWEQNLCLFFDVNILFVPGCIHIPRNFGNLHLYFLFSKIRSAFEKQFVCAKVEKNTFWCLATDLLKNKKDLKVFFKRRKCCLSLMEVLITLKTETLIHLKEDYWSFFSLESNKNTHTGDLLFGRINTNIFIESLRGYMKQIKGSI